jgi:hypothetical protein
MMKITKTQLRRIIKEEVKNISEDNQMSFDFREPGKRELEQALEAFDYWAEDQVARDEQDVDEPEHVSVVRWMASRNSLSGRKYIHLLPQIASEYGFYKKDIMSALRTHGSKPLQRKAAEAMQGYSRKPVRGL